MGIDSLKKIVQQDKELSNLAEKIKDPEVRAHLASEVENGINIAELKILMEEYQMS